MGPNNPYEFSQPSQPYGAGGLREAQPLPAEFKHSGLGIASFMIAIGMGLLEFVLFAAAGVLETTTPGGIDENSDVAIILGLALIGGILADMMGIGLGIAGLFQPRRKKIFAVLGIIIGALVLFGVVSLIALGMSMEGEAVQMNM